MSLSQKGWALMWWGVVVQVALLSGRAFGGNAGSDPKVRSNDGCHASVVVIGATATKRPFPKELSFWKKQLLKPPFSFFKGFELLKSLTSGLSVHKKPFVAGLAGPYSMELRLLGTSRSAKGKEQFRFQLKLMQRKGRVSKVISNGTMRLDRGGTFFVAGPKVGRHTLILAITLK